MTVRYNVTDGWALLGSAKTVVGTATTATLDFGTPNDIDLRASSGYAPGDRVVAMFAATSTSTSAVSFAVQDAADNAGNIGTPATAVTSGTLTGFEGDAYAFCSVKVQPDRPWLRFKVIHSTTDDHAVTCNVYAVPRALG